MRVLEGLQPTSVLYYFEEICGIPHISYHEKLLSDYCVSFAKERNLFYQQDELGNVLIIKDATEGYEEADSLIIQGHLDMVGDKLPDCSINMETEPIQIKVEGDYITAEGTTLGGDDGIAVAYALALLDAEDIPHPRLEVVLTVSEEVGLIGATAMDLSACKGRKLINIDSEMEGVLTAGCAGGVRVLSQVPMLKEAAEGVSCRVFWEGLKGGHSGVEINSGLANANVLLGRFLQMLKEKIPYGIENLKGGVKDNVIPKNAEAALVVAEADIEIVKEVLAEFNSQFDVEYGVKEAEGQLKLEIGAAAEKQVLNACSMEKALAVLNTMPNGVQSMSMDLPGLVETSLNMGTVELTDDMLKTGFSVRSSVTSAKEHTVRKVTMLTKILGGTVETSGDYPGWAYARTSELRDRCVDLYKKQTGKEMKVDVIHAGLECGILSSKLEGLDCISIGPDMVAIHSPNEKLSISSVERVWNYLKELVSMK